MPTCNGCGKVVTREFVRVFGVDGAVQACPSCATVAELVEGAASEEESVKAG